MKKPGKPATNPAAKRKTAKRPPKGSNTKPIDWRPLVLLALRQVPVIRHACEAAGIERSTLWRARKDDAEFDRAVQDAMEDGIDSAEKEAFRRAVNGFQEPVVHKGELAFQYEPVLDDKGEIQRDEHGNIRMRPLLGQDGRPVPLTITKHSDQLLTVILKGRRKDVYSERIEQTGAGGGPIEIDASKRAARVAALLALAMDRAAGGQGA